MTTDKELMQEALYALEGYARNCRCEGGGAPCDAAEALRDRLANEFNPDWDAMAVMVEEQQRMAKRIEELEAALAQPEEPDWSAAGFSKPPVRSEQWWKHEVSNAYAQGYEKGRSQREWKGLADEEILEEYRQSYGDDGNLTDIYFAHAIEAKLKEKNGTI